MSLSPLSQQFIDACARRRLIGPLLLFVAGHRPLAFALSQTLYVVHPLASLLGVEGCNALAIDLSAPDSARRLENALTQVAEPPESMP